MRLGSVRDLIGLQPVLRHKEANGPDPVYYMFNNISLQKKWENLTVLVPGEYDSEFPKTYGHYHGSQVDETYQVVSGKGVFLLQRKKFDQKMWLMEQVEEVFAVHGEAGDEITISPDFGHSWSNIGTDPLLLYDNWKVGHTPADYVVIDRLQGMAYYLISDGGKVKFEQNNHYQNLPKLKEMSAKEFRELQKK